MKNALLPILVVVGLAMSDTAALAGEQSFDCMVRHLRANAERLYVRCHAEWRGLKIPAYVREIQYYSAPYSQKNARYIFDLVMEARRQGQPIRLIFEDDPDANPPGCGRNNCRRIIAVGLDY